jgi:hypothetical protein
MCKNLEAKLLGSANRFVRAAIVNQNLDVDYVWQLGNRLHQGLGCIVSRHYYCNLLSIDHINHPFITSRQRSAAAASNAKTSEWADNTFTRFSLPQITAA